MATLSQLFVGLFNAATGGYNNQFKTSDANTLASVVGLVTNRDVTTDANYINVVLGNLGVSTTSAVYGEAYTAMQGLVNTQGRGGAVIAAADFLAAQSKISTSAYYSIGKAFMSNVAKAEAFTATHPTETGVTNLVAAVTGVGGSNTFTTGTDTLSGIAGDELFTALFTTSTTTNTVASTDSLTDSSKTDSDTLTFTVGGDLYSDATTSAAPALRNIENLVFNIDTTTADLATTATYDNSASVLSVDSSTMTGVKSYSFDVVKPVSAVTGVGLLNAASGSVVNVSAKLASAVVGTATTAGNVTINMANAGVPGTPATVTVPTASTDVVVNGAGSLSATASTVTGSVFATAEKAVTVSAAAAKIVNAVAKAGNATISSAAAGTVVDVTASGNVSVTATGAGSLKAVAGGSITTAGTISSTSATFSATGESTLAAANSATSLTLSGNGASATYNMGSATSLANIQVTGDQNVTVKTSGATLPATVSVTDTGSGLFKLELDGAATAHDFSGGLIDVLKFKTDQGGVTTTVKSGQVVTYALDQGAAAIAVKPTATAATNSLTVLLDDGVRNTSAVDVNTSLTITTAKTVLIDGSVDTTSTGAANGYTLTAIDASGANSNVTIASGINNLTLAGTNTVGTGSLTLTGSGTVALGAATLTADTFDASAVTGAVTGTGLSSATVRAIYTGSAADTLTLDGVGTADIRTNAGNDTLTLDNASYSAAKISIDLGAGTDTLVMQSGTKLITGTTGAISLAGVENFKILAAGVSGTDQVSASVLNGQTFNVLASAANATGSLDVLVLDTDKNIDLSGLAASAAADSAIAGMTFITDASANTAGFTFNGIKGAKNTITGTALSDNLTGGGKDDTFNTTTAALFNADHAMIDTIAGGAGNDIVKITTTGGYTIAATDSWANMSSVEKMTTVDNSAAISVTLNANAYDAGLRTIDLSGETTSTVTVNTAAITGGGMSVIGGSGADTITGGSTNDTLKGGAGADVLTGGAGDDSFAFDVSADFATGGAIVDSILGGDGIDTIRIGKGSTAAADFAIANANSWARSSSVETIKAVASSTYNFTVDLPATAFNAGIRTVDLSASAGASNVIDVSDQTSAAISLTLTGSATGATSILGATGNDLITGGSANDTISASAGVDTINAGAGADTITIGGVKQVVKCPRARTCRPQRLR
jgi:Ca2+-binding RTX toxin-like protein